MKTNTYTNFHRRAVILSAAAALTMGSMPAYVLAQTGGAKIRIGIIGSGNVGSAIGGAWVKAGHEVMFSSLDIERDKKLAASLGGGARASHPVLPTRAWPPPTIASASGWVREPARSPAAPGSIMAPHASGGTPCQ